MRSNATNTDPIGYPKTKNARRLKATHDIRIEVLRTFVVEQLKEPECPDPNVSLAPWSNTSSSKALSNHSNVDYKRQVYIVLPKLADLRTVTDHMRPLSNLVRVSATRNGGLKMRIETEDVGLETSWEKCSLPPIECTRHVVVFRLPKNFKN